jgi:hypothetical protein
MFILGLAVWERICQFQELRCLPESEDRDKPGHAAAREAAARGLEGQGESYVRRHAKAPTSGSNRRLGIGIGVIREAFAAQSTDPKGGSARNARRVALPVAVFVVVLTVVAIPALAASPVVVTSPATNNTGVHATLNGTVNPEGEELTQCLFQWGRSSNPSYENTTACVESLATIGAGTSPVAVHADISGLAPQGTSYKYRLVAVNPSGTVNGANETFTTPNIVVPQAPSGVTPNTATLNATINPDGAVISECLFEWGQENAPLDLVQSYPHSAPCVPGAGAISGASPVSVHADISGLHPGTTYLYRLKVGYPTGLISVSGSLQTAGPVVADTWSESVGPTEATLKAEIDPEGSATTYRFEYGTSEAYGQQTEELNVGSDSNVHVLTRYVTGLAPHTTYHYRVVATNGVAENVGSDHVFTTYARRVFNTACPNQDFRNGPAAGLPDCRAYEMVSPVDKAGGDIVATPLSGSSNLTSGWYKSAPDGDKVVYTGERAFGDSLSARESNQYIATRGGDGWSTHGINAPLENWIFHPEQGGNFATTNTSYWAFSEDLSYAWTLDLNRESLAPGDRAGVQNFHRRDNGNDSYEALTTADPLLGSANYAPSSVAFSANGDKTFLTIDRPLTANAAMNTEAQVYEFFNGELSLVSVLPNGVADPGSSTLGGNGEGFLARREATLEHAVSDDGSRVFWRSSSSGGSALYVRIDGEDTVTIDETASAQAPEFWDATPDGARVLFSDPEDGDTDAFTADLSLFNVDTETTTPIAAGVTRVLGSSDDLSYVYFSSKRVLAPGASGGIENIYLYHAGSLTLVASSNRFYPYEWTPPLTQAARVTPDGGRLVFMSFESLTGYDNRDLATGKPAAEVFSFEADSEELRCVSCVPSGARPRGSRNIPGPHEFAGTSLGNFAAGWIPTWEWPSNELRPVSADGSRIFFNSVGPLVPGDTNGVQDVYEWEAPGSGDCASSAPTFSVQNGGCVSLISTGQDAGASWFRSADANGRTVFFTTADSIDPVDPGLIDLYAARVNGGFPPRAARPPCEGDACQSVPDAPGAVTPASAMFRGEGNPTPRRWCGRTARRAAKLNRLAQHARQQRNTRRAAALDKQAKRLKRGTARCRRANRRAGR